MPEGIAAQIGASAVGNILGILASSMLAVTTFSLSTMVAAYAAASSSATPRAATLLIEDAAAQRALADLRRRIPVQHRRADRAQHRHLRRQRATDPVRRHDPDDRDDRRHPAALDRPAFPAGPGHRDHRPGRAGHPLGDEEDGRRIPGCGRSPIHAAAGDRADREPQDRLHRLHRHGATARAGRTRKAAAYGPRWRPAASWRRGVRWPRLFRPMDEDVAARYGRGLRGRRHAQLRAGSALRPDRADRNRPARAVARRE